MKEYEVKITVERTDYFLGFEFANTYHVVRTFLFAMERERLGDILHEIAIKYNRQALTKHGKLIGKIKNIEVLSIKEY